MSDKFQTYPEAAVLQLKQLASSGPLARVLSALGADAESWLVGGMVRNALLGEAPGDIDLAVSLDIRTITARLHQAGLHVVETGLKHGTITAVPSPGFHVEITELRLPGDQSSAGASRIDTDLSARDFTINAIAWSTSSEALLDPTHGLEDLRAGILRCPGSPAARFAEDPLRILRMVRFGPAAGRTLDPATADAARKAGATLTSVSVERIRSELEKILLSAEPAAGFRALRDLELLDYTIPELKEGVGFEQNDYHIHDVFEHTLDVLAASEPDLKSRLCAIFHDTGKPRTLSTDEDGRRHFYAHEVESARICRERMRSLRFPKQLTEATTLLVRQHMRPLECGPSGLRRIMRDLGPEFETWRRFKEADATPNLPREQTLAAMQRFDAMLAAELKRLTKEERRLAVGGDDLIALGMQRGPEIGRVLKNLEEIVMDDPSSNEREKLLELARSLIGTKV